MIFKEDHSIEMFIPVTRTLELAMDDEPKKYFEAQVVEHDTGRDLLIESEVEDQPW